MKITPLKIIIPLIIIYIAYFGIYKSIVSLPNDNVSDALAFGEAVERQRHTLQGLRKKFADNKNASEWEFLKKYANTENWENKFKLAEASFNQLQLLHQNVILDILDEDHKDRLIELTNNLKVGRLKLKSSISDSQYPRERAKQLVLGRDNKALFYNRSELWTSKSKVNVSIFSKQAKKSIQNHPLKTKDIRQKIGELNSINENIKAVFSILKNEYMAADINFAIYIDSYAELNAYQLNLNEFIIKNAALLKQLDSSYIKVLKDQKATYYVKINRANWCESDHCYDGSEMRYPSTTVDADTFEYFDNLDIKVIAKDSPGIFGGGFQLSIPQNRWDALAINPRYRWNNREPYAEYWVEAVTIKTWHKYTILTDGVAQEHDWVSVSNKIYSKHEGHLGMAILTKPLGEYDLHTITDAEPVGMAVIATPTMKNNVATGSNQYGEWRQSGGNSYWHYYGMYRFFGSFVTPGRYSYNDWSAYSAKGRQGAYYGQKNEYGTFGSSTYKHDKYKNSEYSRRNPRIIARAKTGKGIGIGSSIRGAGPSGRGKGPSGSGK